MSRRGLVEEVYHWEVGFDVSKAQATLSVSLFLLPRDLNGELSATLQRHVCMHATMLPAMMTMD